MPCAASFTGFVDDVRDHARDAQAFVIPLRVGGGTRIKAFEAMAAGVPTVSTTIGVEGLAVEPDLHFLAADTEEAFAEAVIRLLREPALRRRLAHAARDLVETDCAARSVGTVFEAICVAAVEARRRFSASPAQIPLRGTSAA